MVKNDVLLNALTILKIHFGKFQWYNFILEAPGCHCLVGGFGVAGLGLESAEGMAWRGT